MLRRNSILRSLIRAKYGGTYAGAP